MTTARDFSLCGFELPFAVALQRTKNFAGEAFRMDANEDRRFSAHFAHHERHMIWRESTVFRLLPAAKHDHVEKPMCGGHRSLGKDLELRPEHRIRNVHLELLSS